MTPAARMEVAKQARERVLARVRCAVIEGMASLQPLDEVMDIIAELMDATEKQLVRLIVRDRFACAELVGTLAAEGQGWQEIAQRLRDRGCLGPQHCPHCEMEVTVAS